MPRSRFDGPTLNVWRVRHGLRVDEMAFVFGYSVGRLKDKLYGHTPIRLETERIVDLVDLALHRGYPPPGWPPRLSDAVHVNMLPTDPASDGADRVAITVTPARRGVGADGWPR